MTARYTAGRAPRAIRNALATGSGAGRPRPKRCPAPPLYVRPHTGDRCSADSVGHETHAAGRLTLPQVPGQRSDVGCRGGAFGRGAGHADRCAAPARDARPLSVALPLVALRVDRVTPATAALPLRTVHDVDRSLCIELRS